MKSLKQLTIVMLISALLVSCATMNNTTKGGLIGAGAGAALGAGIGKLAGNTAVGTIIGAAVGGTAGVFVGKYMDKQVAELQNDLKDAKIERVGEGIKITFDSGLLFAVNSSDLNSRSRANLDELAAVLNKYPDTNILIEGHTDDTGSNDYNMKLSERRASGVSGYLMANQVLSTRLITKGYGEEQPIVENSSEANRSMNRRVEIAIYANDKLKKAAEKGQLGEIN
ncbi:hypothetical protein EYV94_12450 [Puteibacter caeruleilacunae]|nr:hypothetical protein EYV94_12450 [Puteibacter caeruleilacunae]